MKFDIARQQLIPAFLTLLILAAVAMWGAAKRPAAMPQSYLERVAAYRLAAEAAENAESAETAHAAEHMEAAAQPDRAASDPTVPSPAAQQPTAGMPAGFARDSLTLTVGPGTTQTIPAASTHTASPEHGTESLQTTHPDRPIAAADSTHSGRNGAPVAGIAPAHPAPPITAADSAANTAGKNTTAADSSAAAGHTTAVADTKITTAEETTASGADPETAETLTEEPHDRMMIRFPGEWLADFEAHHPGGSRWIGGLLILFTGLCIGRLTARNNLYSVGTCLAIPLYGILLCGIGDGAFLSSCAAPALLALATKNYARSFRNGFGFDAIFRASLYLGLLPLVAPAALPLLLLLPLAVQLFRRTLRELTVALAGVLLPLFVLCYINWGVGGDFAAPLLLFGRLLTCGPLPTPEALLPLPKLLFAGAAVVLGLLSTLFVFADRYAVGTKPRFILLFACITLILACGSLCSPAATAETVTLLAVPVTLLLPFLFVRVRRPIAAPLYAALLAVAVANVILQ